MRRNVAHLPWTVFILVCVAVSTSGVTGCTTGDRPSIVLVVVDTLRADHLGLYGYTRNTSPHLDRWASAGRVFERAHSTSPWTLPSFGSLYTGYLPSRHRAGFSYESGRRLSPFAVTLAEQLSAVGFHTAAVVNNPFLGPEFGLERGFEVYDHVAGDNRELRRADQMVDRSLALIDHWDGDPFLLVIHLFDPHLDYDAPGEFRGLFSERYETELSLPVGDLNDLRQRASTLSDQDRAFVVAAYDEEIAFVDQQLGRLRTGLSDRGLLDESLIIVTSDHGEELFEHGGFEHGHAMWQELLHVPLVVWGPGVEAGRDTTPVSLVDIFPTVLESVGLSIPGDLDGRSLWPALSVGRGSAMDDPLIAEAKLYGKPESVIIDWPLKLVLNERGHPAQAFSLDVDPREELDLRHRDDLQPVLLTLSQTLEERLRVGEQIAQRLGGPERERANPSDETLQRLRALGYIR